VQHPSILYNIYYLQYQRKQKEEVHVHRCVKVNHTAET